MCESIDRYEALKAERDHFRGVAEKVQAESGRLRSILQDAQVLTGEDATAFLRKMHDNEGKAVGPVPTPKLEEVRRRIIADAKARAKHERLRSVVEAAEWVSTLHSLYPWLSARPWSSKPTYEAELYISEAHQCLKRALAAMKEGS